MGHLVRINDRICAEHLAQTLSSRPLACAVAKSARAHIGGLPTERGRPPFRRELPDQTLWMRGHSQQDVSEIRERRHASERRSFLGSDWGFRRRVAAELERLTHAACLFAASICHGFGTTGDSSFGGGPR
jgi:hypothetical protein